MLKKQEQDILDIIGPGEQLSKAEIAERLQCGEWGVYPHIRSLEAQGLLISNGFRRDRKKVYAKQDQNNTPKLHFQGLNSNAVSIWEIAKRAKVMTEAEQPIITSIVNLPLDLLLLYKIAARVNYGHEFERKEYLAIRSRLMTLKQRLENYLLATNELLAHPVMDGDPRELVRVLMQDETNPIAYEEIQAL